MAIVVPYPHYDGSTLKGGEAALLRYIIGVNNNPIMHLFSSNTTPTDSGTKLASDFTECTSAGYAPVTLPSAYWWYTFTNSNVTSALYTEQAFNFTTSATVYGYYVTNSDGDLLWTERFAVTAFVIPEGGGSITIQPKLSLA